MSRFFATTYEYDSDSSSSESDLLSSSEEELLSSSGEESDDSLFNEDSEGSDSDVDSDDSDGKPYGPDWFKKSEFRKSGGSGGNKFLKGANYSDSEGSESDDEGKKVVKSAKDKLLDEMQTVFDKIETAEMSDDWISVLNEFDNITRLLVRAQQQNWGTPNIFIKVVAQVEDLVNSTSQADIKKKDVARAYNTARQRVRKVAKENETSMTQFRENPDEFDKEPTVDLESSEPAMDINAQFAANKSVNLSSLAAASSEVSFFTSLRIVIDSRGKKNVNSQDMINIIEDLLASPTSPYESIMAYLSLIPIRMEATSNLSYQPIDQWTAAYNDYMALLNLLEDSIATYRVSELATFNEDIETEPVADAQGVKNILGSLFAFVERLDDEFTKSLLNLDPHSSEYLMRLKDEQLIYNMILKTQLYLEQTLPAEKKESLLARVFVKRLDHIYFKSDKLNIIIETNAWKSVPQGSKSEYIPVPETIDGKYISALINSLCDILIKQEDSFLRTRAILYCVFFTASNGNFHAAKEMLLTSKVQSNISKSNSSLQVLFNRVVVQLGLSAFQACLIEECHQVLNELLASAHLKEILGQQPLQRINSNIENREEQCIPYHQHINLDLIDVVFMTCSLLIEIPQMTAFYSGIRIKRLPYSQKSIRRVLEHHDKSSFQGPPETSRDFVLYAAKSMQKGDWEASIAYLKNIKSWNMLPNKDVVMENLVERIRIESMKSYLYTYKRFYAKFCIKQLADVFNLDTAKVVEILESIIAEFEINFKLNDDKTALVVESSDEITKLEEVALRLNKEYKITKERLFPSRRR
ncbi:similar to Saccharomyces cerevisiae YMR309C NIP1 eIF3c subunit of the eukaryotic translation initiation factor 3 (eIF3), involved in the assembly of preinitiation complex and start codon selection [Maudiozyma barnettii]|uniref:Similar to Saccharomyces cerevisiae YMR309C NIP1 eIF3c subunit of the eukaryotic translation initiation factor 3 (eIF3), involved in the assembly of preinitiation complex and start codon selection n=1 Tax=Maudiozyma barnettii TaxID=61262 RepID=A0A8H2VJ06_9SACH|nr:translation initiation factor eIF3 core subunit c [Kazachstania barnettii]CAB4256154.1 similar to Saccharomyces cerevisiae YMR309C NIP1 eIF3c subunit of the eukaryotic translation initiation factor 3 (eIF3), involved in the assembly of preinitiation complex and start codon selection [Kazachstania barnettii]CAD1784762.1 similar to Saccharomyces cerevisiae YMR309C NIP1 eIF3c subunit of the eukaryotic translation initiation factor 3 (eIF3), involved in the assembly of preinitiation complex and st